MLWNQFFLYSMFAISFIFCKWFKKKKGRERRECTQSACDGCLTLKAIWFHDAGHRSGAFYDHSQYIPQVCAERRQKQTQSSLLMGQHDDTFVPLLELNGCLRSNTKKIFYFKLNSYSFIHHKHKKDNRCKKTKAGHIQLRIKCVVLLPLKLVFIYGPVGKRGYIFIKKKEVMFCFVIEQKLFM